MNEKKRDADNELHADADAARVDARVHASYARFARVACVNARVCVCVCVCVYAANANADEKKEGADGEKISSTNPTPAATRHNEALRHTYASWYKCDMNQDERITIVLESGVTDTAWQHTCKACRQYFRSTRSDAQTCCTACRKALSRRAIAQANAPSKRAK